MGYVIRRAEMEDARVLAAIQTQALLAAYEGIIPLDEIRNASEGYLQMWQEKIKEDKDILAIAEIDGVNAGFLALHAITDAKTKDRTMEMYALYFLPEFWGLRKAKALVKYATDYSKKRRYDGLFFWVLEANKRARRFCEKNDFSYDARERISTIGGVEFREMRYWNTLIGGELRWWRLV